MTLLTGPVLTTGVAARRCATSKLAASLVLALPALVSTDVVTNGALLAGELVALPVLGLRARPLLRAWPVLVALAGVWLANAVAGADLTTLAGLTLRIVAVALPGMLFVLSTDPTDLADALVQRWHAPARFAYGALAAFRLLPLLAGELVSLRLARRARGIDGGRNPVAWARIGAELLFALLVSALRRGVRLAAAMDARGFGAVRVRGVARPVRVGPADRALVAGALVLAVAAVAVAVGTGRWAPVFG